MKKTIRALATYAGAAIMAASLASVSEVTAQTTTPAPAAAAQGGCTPEAKLAWYTEFRATFKTDQNKAYDLAQKYLACPTAPEEENIAKYLRETFVATIDKARRPAKVSSLVYESKDYPKAFELGQQILADEPENLRVLIDLGFGGYAAVTAKNESFRDQSITYARKAIQEIEAGKAPANWAPYKSKEDTLAYLYNSLGQLLLKNHLSDALSHLIKAAQFQSELQKDPWTYFYIGAAYEADAYKRLSEDYKARFEGKDESPESKLAIENINQVVDRMVDAYARAVSLAGTNPKYAAKKIEWMDGLASWYKYRHNNSDAGLTEEIARIMTKPLPSQPTPITTLPSTPATPSAPVSGTGGGNGPAAPAAAKPAPAAAKPAPVAASSTPATVVKPKKNNHARARTKRGH